MRTKTTFQVTARYFSLGEKPNLQVMMKFENCTYEDFHAWLEKNQARLTTLKNTVYDVGFSDKVILFTKC